MSLFVIKTRTDLLGSFTQHLLYARLLSDYYQIPLVLNEKSDFNDFAGFDFNKVGNDTQEEHLKNRELIASCLVNKKWTTKKQSVKHLNNPLKIEKEIINIGFNKVVNDESVKPIRDSIMNILPKTPKMNEKTIVIHFRAGDAVTMKNRYIHSSEYKNIIEKLKIEYPLHKIIIYTHKIPEREIDDFSVFNGFEIRENEPSILETWRIFIEADVLVMARSSFSHVPALLRYSYQTTYYANFWHHKSKEWKVWY